MDVVPPLARSILLCLICLELGCDSPTGPSTANPPSPTAKTASDGQPTQPAQAANQQTKSADGAAAEESWFAYYLGGGKLGYMQLTKEPVTEAGQNLVRWTAVSRLTIEREKQVTKVSMQFVNVETPGGQLLRLEGETRLGPSPTHYKGQVADGVLRLEDTSRGKPETQTIPWSDEIGGFFTVERSLSAQPLRPGEKRTIKKLEPIVNQVVTVDLVAHDYEATRLLDGSAELLRIDNTLTFAGGQKLQTIVWTDRQGQTHKTQSRGEPMESYRTTRERALSEPSGVRFDLALDTRVKLNRPLENPHATRQIRYRVRLKDDDPLKVFVSGPTQKLKSLDAHTAELTVRAWTASEKTSADWPSKESPPSDEDRNRNNMVQSDDPRIVEMATKATFFSEPDRVALALERHVHDLMKPNYRTAFASAADVAADPQGDCTEFAVLLAALARARGIPARVAMGLIYVGGEQPAFAFHMWSELYVGGHWVPLDATLGRGRIGAAHLKLADSNLAGGSAFTSFLPVSNVLRKLEVEILEVE